MKATARVLVVDDEPVVNESCLRILSQRGYEVNTTESGREGLDRALTQDYDLVITDLKMPDLDGMEVVRTLKRQRPDLSVVIITGYATVASALEAGLLGIGDYLEKPFTPNQLMEAVQRALPARKEQLNVLKIDALLVRKVLTQAANDPEFDRRLSEEGSRALSGMALSSETKAAIICGDISWLEKQYGELSAEERSWLERRLSAEVW